MTKKMYKGYGVPLRSQPYEGLDPRAVEDGWKLKYGGVDDDLKATKLLL